MSPSRLSSKTRFSFLLVANCRSSFSWPELALESLSWLCGDGLSYRALEGICVSEEEAGIVRSWSLSTLDFIWLRGSRFLLVVMVNGEYESGSFTGVLEREIGPMGPESLLSFKTVS